MEMKEGAGTPLSALSHGRPPRPRSTSYTTTATSPPDLSPLSPHASSPSHVFTSRPHTPPLSWGSHPGSPVGLGEGVEGVRGSGSHSRLPSTDSGIQADAGWDSLGRSYHRSFGKVSADNTTSSSPDCRTPLKTLTRCLMEPRLAAHRSSWGELPTGSSSSSRAMATTVRSTPSDSDIRLTSSPGVRPRTMSCDQDDRLSSGRMTPRMVSSFPSGSGSMEVQERAPTTRGEEWDSVRRRARWRSGADNLLSRSVDSALPVSLATAMVSSMDSASLRPDQPEDYRTERAGASLERSGKLGSRTDQLGSRSEQPAVRSELSGRTADHAGSRYPQPSVRSVGTSSVKATTAVPVFSLSRVTSPSSFSSSSVLTTSSSPSTSARRALDKPLASTVSLLSSSTPVLPSRPPPDRERGATSQGGEFHAQGRLQPHGGEFHAQGRLQSHGGEFHAQGRLQPHGGEFHAQGRLQPQGGEFHAPGRLQSRLAHQPADSAVNGSRLPKFRLASPTAPSSSPARLDGGPARGGPGSGGAVSAVSHHFKPRVTPLSVSRLVSGSSHSSSPKVLSVQSGDRRAVSGDARPVAVVAAVERPSVSQSGSGPHGSDGGLKGSSGQSTAQSTAVSHASPRLAVMAQVLPAVSDPDSQPGPFPTHPLTATTTTTTTAAKLQDDATPSHPSSATASLSIRPRHAAPLFRSKLSPVLSRNMLRAKIPITAISPSPSSLSPSVSLGRPIPVKHVDTCSACLKPAAASASSSDVIPKDGGSSTGADVVPVVVVPSTTSTIPEGVLQLVQRSAHVPGEGGGGAGGGGGEVRGEGGERTIPVVDIRKEVPWKERRSRIDSALTWLRGELEGLRAMDTVLMTQFRRCQDTIETLKQQHELNWGDGEGSEWGWGLDGSEFDEEEEAWEDWEIAEFERRWAQDPEAGELDIALLPVTSASVGSGPDNTAMDVRASPPSQTQQGRGSPSPLKQDVEATL